ncbi:HNH endonuclease [Streptomyces canus]|uniref:HNH endonuclease n=1 Tax=Streptomyces canus TaxID=58343 RepID=UPI00224DB564|nr:HNH endonuclease signature motif containing protein [Streptomyces canus]MCX4860255.1 HNH endonuclease [Streptomyces canus]WSZ58024.1 HNH endonuclease [Streptomyces canus]
MIFIDIQEVISTLGEDWKKEAQLITKKLKEAKNEAERKTLIAEHEGVWRQLKAKLSAFAHHKCWYCETFSYRSDNSVDHFRPKSRVYEDKGHPGYWWLAFSPANYRFACTFCNSRRHDVGGTSGGKHDHFPLVDGSPRAVDPYTPLSVENPLLLDPCWKSDVAAFWFDETGEVSVNPPFKEMDDHAEEKVDASRHFYHLDQVSLVEARRRVYLRVLSLCDQADDSFISWQKTKDHSAKMAFREAMNAIARMRDRTAEHSAVAHCAIRGYRHSSISASLSYDSAA